MSGESFRPVRAVDLEITRPILASDLAGWSHGGYGRACVLVRYHGEPLGTLTVDLASADCSVAGLTRTIVRELGDEITRRRPPGVAPSAAIPVGEAPETSAFLRERARVLMSAPPMSVILCTTGSRADDLGACLGTLFDQRYPDFEIVVVDNAPGSGRARAVVDALRADAAAPLRRVEEPRPGLSWARNRGVSAAAGDIVCWIDDDELADVHWLAELARGFACMPEVACVTGAGLPWHLDTQAQAWFEEWGGQVKGRGLRRWVFDDESRRTQSHLYPLPPFGTGGNAAIRIAALRDVGGFDVALGAGTPAGACEDTEMFARLLVSGHRIVYQPTAVTRHKHRASVEELARQLHEYGLGLTAYYTSLLMRRPALALPLLGLLGRGVRDLVSRESVTTARMETFPPELLRLQRRGMLRGPAAYIRSRRVQRQAARAAGEHARPSGQGAEGGPSR